MGLVKFKQLKHSDIPKIREKLLRKQNGLCSICNNPPNRACLDHEHKKRLKGSGRVRGVLCSSCNVFLAKMENNCVRYGIGLQNLPSILKRVAKYIEQEHTKYIHPSEKPKTSKLKKTSYNKFKKLWIETFKKDLPKSLEYPKSGTLTKPLEKAYKTLKIEPEFYK